MDRLLQSLGQSIVDDSGVTTKDPRRSSTTMILTPAAQHAPDATRRLLRPSGSAPPFGIPMPTIVESILDREDKRLWRARGAISAALGQSRGIVIISSLNDDASIGEVTAGLAAGLILSERRPLLLLDLEYPAHTLQRIIGYASDLGLPDVLRGRFGLAEVTASCRDPRVGFLGGGTREPSLSELGSLKSGEIMVELVQIFDLVMAALPPGDNGVTEVLASAASALGVKVFVIVLMEQENPARLAHFSSMVELAGGKVLGWVLA